MQVSLYTCCVRYIATFFVPNNNIKVLSIQQKFVEKVMHLTQHTFLSSVFFFPSVYCDAYIAPSGTPGNITASQTSNSILLTWEEVDCSKRNGKISNYLISYHAAGEAAQHITTAGFQEIIMGLSPSTGYSVSIAAVNDENEVGPAWNSTIWTTGTRAGSRFFGRGGQ